MDYTPKRTLRNSVRIPTPELFITKEIQNQTAKQKNRHHRQSVLNELKATESLLNDSLNKNIKLNHSGFLRITEATSSEKSIKVIAKQSAFAKSKSNKENKEESLRKKKSNPQFKKGSEIGQKLKQLINISYQFEKACETKKPAKFKCQTQENYSLPAIEEDSAMASKEISQKQKQAWKQKLKMGRKWIQLMKQKPAFCTPTQRRRQQPVNTSKEGSWQMPQALKFSFLKPYKLERETAPVNATNNSFYQLFVSRREQTSHQPQRRLQLQPLLTLQQFAAGGEPSAFNEYSKHLNLKDLMVKKQKFKFLKRIYNYVKENCLQTRDFSQDELEQANLLSLVYYMENASNLTQHEKKNMRKRFKFIQ